VGSLEDWFALWEHHHGQKNIHTAYLIFESPEPWRPIPLENAFLEHLQLFQHQGPVPERPLPLAYTLRPLEHDSDWSQLVDLTIKVDHADRNPDYLKYMNWYLRGCRTRIAHGQGRWWGAWQQGQLASAGGLFWQDHEARFQTVETHPAHRRRGLAAAIIAKALRERHQRGPAYIAANTKSLARDFYPKLGFEVCSHAYELGRHQG
jgi:GNAT superfamily N-acetyltransferase